MKQVWQKTADPDSFVELYAYDLLALDTKQKNKLFSKISFETALRLTHLGKAKMLTNDLKPRISQWIQSADYKMASQLIQAGLASKKDFKPRISQWIQSANYKMASQLTQAGLASKKDFKPRISQWIQSANYKMASQLIQAGLASKKDFKPKVLERIQSPNIQMLLNSYQFKWANKNDLRSVLSQKIPIIGLKNAKKLINVGLATKEDFIAREFYNKL